MELRSLSGRKRLATKIRKAADSQTAEDIKVSSQDVGIMISPAQGTLLRNANAAYVPFYDAKTVSFPLSLTIDASVVVDQLKPAARLGVERRDTLRASILGAVEEKRGNIAREQESEEEKDKNDKKTPEANGVCTFETYEKEKTKGETCADISARKESLARDREISPSKLSEMINKEIHNSIKEINNSIKDAVQTIVRQCSMEEKKTILPCSKEPEKKSHAYRSRVAEEIARRKKSLNACTTRQRVCHVSRQYNNVSAYDNSYPYIKTRENAISLPVKKVNNVKNSKKPANIYKPVTTDNRRMTGNVNIFICSEANKNSQDKKKLKLQSCTNTSSATTTERSDSRCASVSSAISCKLINCIQEKRKKLQAPQAPNLVHEKRDSDNDIACDDRISRRIRKKESNVSSEEQADVKVGDDGVVCKDTVLSTRDSCCCEDASFSSTADLRQDSSDSVIPCSSLDVHDNSRRLQSWTAVHPSAARASLDNNDVSLSNAICINAELRNHRRNDDRNYVCGNDSERAVCEAIDSGRWLTRSIYTDCGTCGELPKERCADSCEYRKDRPRDWVLNRNGVWGRQIGYKLPRQPLESCQRKHVTRRRSACTCIAEEEEEEEEEEEGEGEEDHCTNRVERKLAENVCGDAKCPEKISACRTPSRKSAARTRARERAFGDLAECPRGATVCVTTSGNSEELAKVTRVRGTEFVAEEPPRDIAVRGAMFGEPRGPAEEIAVREAAPDGSKEAPEETICKKIPGSNFANQNDVKRVHLNDAEDKLAKENTSGSNLSKREENAGNAGRVAQPDNKYDNVAPDNFTERKSAEGIKQGKQAGETVSNNRSEVSTAPVELITDSPSLLENIYSETLPRAEFDHRPNRDAKETSKTFYVQRRRTQLSSNQTTSNYFQRTGKVWKKPATQNLVSIKNDQSGEKTQEKLKDEEDKLDVPKEIQTMEEKPRDSLLHRSFKKVLDIIKRDKTRLTSSVETEKTKKSEKTITNDSEDIGKSKTVSKNEDKIDDEKDQQEISKKVTIKSPPAKREMTAASVASPKSTGPITNIIISEENKKSISIADQTPRLKPKLLRVIAAKRSHLPSTAIAADSKPQKLKAESIPGEIIGHVDQEEIPEERIIPQKPVPAEITEEIKAEESVASEISGAEIKDSPKDVIDIPKDIADGDKISKIIPKETTKAYVPCSQKKLENEAEKLVSCKCGLPSDLNDCSCLIAKCIKCNNTAEDCLCKHDGLEQNENYCTRCRSPTAKCTCAPTQYLKSCLKTDKPKFCSISPSKISPWICTDCYRIREEYKCRSAFCCQPHEDCRYKWCATHSICSKRIEKCGPRDQCCCATSALMTCRKTKKGCSKKAKICLYCDNPQDKCTCRAPIGKCTRCELPSDICSCLDCDREQIAGRPSENKMIRVTSWKPRREIRRYFVRNLEDLRFSDSAEECRCHGKPNRQRPEELPYQRLNVFSDVMDELQQKMSESVCCTQCRRNPCCCGSRVDQDKGNKEREAEGCVRCPEMEKSFKRKSHRIKSPNNCWCSSNPKDELKNTVQKSTPIRRIDCACKLSPCRCRKSKFNRKRPLAKCYYCKSLPCTCITAR